jgi:hypothetical protein
MTQGGSPAMTRGGPGHDKGRVGFNGVWYKSTARTMTRGVPVATPAVHKREGFHADVHVPLELNRQRRESRQRSGNPS